MTRPATIILTPNVEPLLGWQWQDQPRTEWPTWVQRSCRIIDGHLVHDVGRGRQVLYVGEWLTKSLDGEQVFYEDDEIRRGFGRK